MGYFAGVYHHIYQCTDVSADMLCDMLPVGCNAVLLP